MLFVYVQFDDADPENAKVKDIIDAWRARRDLAAQQIAANGSESGSDQALHHMHVDFAGHGVLIVAKETVNDAVPLCLGLGPTGNKPKLVPCFHDIVVPTLAEGWETGAVVLEETLRHNRWTLGPCTSDGTVERLPKSATMNTTPGVYSPTGPRCQLKQMDGQRSGRCFDAESGKSQPGGRTQVFPCSDKWYQFLSFGDSVHAPVGSLYTKIPSHIVKQIINLGHDQIQFMCLGVVGRGDRDEEDWDTATDEPASNSARRQSLETTKMDEFAPLAEWLEQEIITTQCTNTGGVIEWQFVPFIVEEATSVEETTEEEPVDESEGTKLGSDDIASSDESDEL